MPLSSPLLFSVYIAQLPTSYKYIYLTKCSDAFAATMYNNSSRSDSCIVLSVPDFVRRVFLVCESNDGGRNWERDPSLELA